MTLLPSVWPVTTAWPDGPTNTPEVTSCWCCSCWFMAPHPEDWKKKPNLFRYRSCSFQSSNFSRAKVESSSLFCKKVFFHSSGPGFRGECVWLRIGCVQI
ncbi:hypothetical protein CDAR_224721 [Caerostris darwini]|uniref:Secreted protein n=1 Tax=Caerostris darwini TaxID=1538125 RepID=A0AAV4N9L1_9ARAC|nr:hypothetical protein CDAR_224721 [Caerostris darwini]